MMMFSAIHQNGMLNRMDYLIDRLLLKRSNFINRRIMKLFWLVTYIQRVVEVVFRDMVDM